MKNQKTVFEFGDAFDCVQFTNVDPDVSGVEIFRDGERLGSIVGLHIPDIEDEEENKKFDDAVIAWIVDNCF